MIQNARSRRVTHPLESAQERHVESVLERNAHHAEWWFAGVNASVRRCAMTLPPQSGVA
jgi:hypothetical protein